MDWKFLTVQKGIINFLAAAIGLILLIVLAFSLNALFASRSSQITNQLQSPSSSSLSLPPTTVITQENTITRWKSYRNEKYDVTIKYPLRIKVEESLVDGGLRSDGGKSLAVKFYSPEATPRAMIPQEEKAAELFADQYILVYLRVYDNDLDLPLRAALEQLYSSQITVSNEPAFEAIESNLQPSEVGPQGALMFTGSVGENPQKSVYFAHKGLVYTITLYGGPDTGSSYSELAENTFDSMVSSIELQ